LKKINYKVLNLLNKKPNLKWALVIVFSFFIIALILTFPLALNFKNSIPATDGGDASYFIWNLWEFKHTIFDLHENPFGWSKLLFYPIGFSQAATGYDNLYNIILSIPISFFTGNYVVIYNILLLLNITLSGLGMFLLVLRHFSSNRKIAFLISFSFAFCPYAMHRLFGHINLATIQWIPFFLIYFLQLLKTPNKKNAFLSALFLFLIAISSWHYLIYLILVIIFFIIYRTFFEKREAIKWKNYIYALLIFFAISLILIIPVVLPFIKASFAGGVVKPNAEEFDLFSADPLSYFTPSPLYLIGKKLIPLEIYASFSGNITESTTYLGIIEIALILLFISYWRRFKSEEKIKYKKWIWFSTIFYLLSLGPHLKIIGNVWRAVPLPMYFLLKLPLFSFARDSVRLNIFVLIGTLVILTIFLDYLSKNITKKIFKQLIIFLFIAFFIERIMIPMPIKKMENDPFYNMLRQDKEQYAIIELPMRWDVMGPKYDFAQTIHQKNISNGDLRYTALTNQTSVFINNDPLLKWMFCNYQNKDQLLNMFIPPSGEELREIYLKNNFRYILLHKNYLEYPICEGVKEIANNYFSDIPRVYEDDDLIVIDIKDL